ncbi:MAG TPA: hypothetical protein VGL22_19615 [Terracidiphilus sp.]
MTGETYKRPLNVSFRRGSRAERVYRERAGLPQTEALAPGLKPHKTHDLHYHGGKLIADLHFKNFYVGGTAWHKSDKTHIDAALSAAMADEHLNNVMQQYFPGAISTTFDGSEALPGNPPTTVSQTSIEQMLTTAANQGKLAGSDLKSTVFNFMLPPGTVLNDDTTGSGAKSHQEHDPADARKKSPVPLDDDVDSLHGLGGYHGSIHLNGQTIYYAVGVYSQVEANGTENGIPVFDKPWKNVVATFYHELNEARTDPDVEDAIRAGNDPSAIKFLGWTSKQGEECGDYPVFEAGNDLQLVFQEVELTSGKGTVPVQFQYSNHAHGPEGPVTMPDPKSHTTLPQPA